MDELRIPVVLEDATQTVAASSNFLNKHKAILYSIAHRDDPPDNLIRAVSEIEAGHIDLPADSVLLLRDVFVLAPPDIAETRRNTWFDGDVSPAAGWATEAVSLVARTWPPSRADGVPQDQFVPLDADIILRKALRVLLRVPDNTNLGAVIKSNEFRSATGIDLQSSSETIVGRLPPQTRDFIEKIRSMGSIASTGRSKVEEFLSGPLASVMPTAEEDFRNTVRDFRQGALDDRQLNRLTELNRSIRAYHAIGLFILGDILRNRELADKFSSGVQAANVALQVGLLFGTGGLGSMAGAATLMSALGGMEGAFGRGVTANDAATRETLRQLQQQVENLRREMHQRFDRLEMLQESALDYLSDISRQLANFRVDVKDLYDRLSTDVTRVRRDVRNAVLDAKFEEFNKAVGQIKILAAAGALADPQEIDDWLQYFLDYALVHAKNHVFQYSPVEPLATLVPTIGRIDRATSLLSRAGEVLEVRGAQRLGQNPIEWARGVQGFVESQLLFPAVRNHEIDAMAVKAFNEGLAMWTTSKNLCTRENLGAARRTYIKRRTGFVNAIQESILANEGSKKTSFSLGRRRSAVHSEPFLASDYEKDRGRVFVWDTTGHVEEWKFVYVDDRVDRAENLNRLVFQLQHEQRGHKDWRYDKGRVEYNSNIVWYRYPIEVRSSDPVTFKEIDYVTVPIYGPPVIRRRLIYGDIADRQVVSTFQAYRVDGNRVEAFLNTITGALDYTHDIREWIENLPRQRDLRVDDYLEAAAALAVIVTMMNWVTSGHLDDPWRGAVASHMPRCLEDVQKILWELAEGVRPGEVELLKPVGTGSAEETAQYSEIVNRLSGRDPEGLVTWQELDVYPQFARLAPRLIYNWTEEAVRYLDLLAAKLPVQGSLNVIDDGLARLRAWLLAAGL